MSGNPFESRPATRRAYLVVAKTTDTAAQLPLALFDDWPALTEWCDSRAEAANLLGVRLVIRTFELLP